MWDLFLFRAMRAEDDGDFTGARRRVENVLASYPNSSFATWDLAAMWIRQGNCKNAGPHLIRALQIIDTKADPLSKRGYVELRRAVSASLARCNGK